MVLSRGQVWFMKPDTGMELDVSLLAVVGTTVVNVNGSPVLLIKFRHSEVKMLDGIALKVPNPEAWSKNIMTVKRILEASEIDYYSLNLNSRLFRNFFSELKVSFNVVNAELFDMFLKIRLTEKYPDIKSVVKLAKATHIDKFTKKGGTKKIGDFNFGNHTMQITFLSKDH